MGKENFVSKVVHLGKEKLFGKGDVKIGGGAASPTRGGYKGGLSKHKSIKHAGKKKAKGLYSGKGPMPAPPKAPKAPKKP